MNPRKMEPRDVIHFATPDAFRAWLEKEHACSEELWVGYWKKSTGIPSVSWEETVDEALCFGWIDGIRKRVDDNSFVIRFTPRRAKSNWSCRNIERYSALSAEGRVTLAGQAAFARRTEARSGVYCFEQASLPELSDEYIARIRANPAAWRYWQARPPGYRKQAVHWILSAKQEATRDRRLAALIADSAEGRKVKPFR
jgi:uncharacterized protein YdeI (YjbR/CyaY-like superfamily)